MKRLLHIICIILLAFSGHAALWAQTQAKQLPDVTTTEGREFFVAWLPNSDRDPNSADLKLQLIANSRQGGTIVVEYPDGSKENHPISAGATVYIDVDPKKVYWDQALAEEEKTLNKGLRVYSMNGEKFTLYSTNQAGTAGTYSFDGAHILPVEALGTEYMVQSADADAIATEFVVMSTQPGPTNVTMELKVNSRRGGSQQLNVTLNGPKQIYIVRSKAPNPDETTEKIDLSGSSICADQPIAVWSGNQFAIVPNQEGMNNDHAYDQLLPLNKWGKQFIVPMTACRVKLNIIRVVAMQDSTSVQVMKNNRVMESPLMNSGDVYSRRMVQSDATSPEKDAYYITANKPIQVYLFSSSGANSTWYDDNDSTRLPGDPSMTLIPPLEYLTDTTIFSTHNAGDGQLEHQVNIWALRSQIANVQLRNSIGQSVPLTWKTVPSNTAYSQGSASLTHGTYSITAPTKCFSGYAYGINDGQAYLYPVGYDFTPRQDSLFLLDNDSAYAIHESEWKADFVSPTEGGWYLSRILQDDGTYLLDTTFVCDSTLLTFPIKTYNAWDKVLWEIKGSIQGTDYFTPFVQQSDTVARPELEHRFHLLPIEENQEPYEDFEIRAILSHKPILCDIPEDKWQRDTFSTVVRAMRQYNDTTWRVICVGDTVQFFKDTVWINPAPTSGKPVPGVDYVLQVSIFNDTLTDSDLGYYQYQLGDTTITKQYTSSGGCDSLSTLKLFVCSPYFEHRDTVVCEDELRTLQPKYGDFFKRYKDYSKWPKADTVLYDTLRAKGCMSTPEYQEYTKHCPSFNGCDSVLELHLTVKKVITNIVVENRCLSFGNTYDWKEDKSGRLIRAFCADTMTLDSAYTFQEFVKYVECTDCRASGCDSVRNILRLMFVSDAGQRHTVHVCQDDKYTYKNMNFVTTFDTKGKVCNTPYQEIGVVEIYGYVDDKYQKMCEYEDTVVFYVDTVFKNQMTYDTICLANTGSSPQTYSWANHPNYNAIPVTKGGLFTYTDTLQTYDTGCDSICVLELRVGIPYHVSTLKEICDDDSVSWQDTIFYGINFKNPLPAGRPNKQVTGTLYTSQRDTVSRYGCDSILTFSLQIHPTYVAEQKDTFVCANEPYYFYGEWYNTPEKPWVADSIYQLEIHDNSIHGCDSAVLHRITVYPIYLDEREENDTVCQVLSSTPVYYEWEGADHAAWNLKQLQTINNAGSYELIDSLATMRGCDSVIHRTLVVMPTYQLPYTHKMSSEDTIHWEGRIYAGEKAIFENPDALPVIVCSGITTIVDSLHTDSIGNHSCDSIRTLTLTIGQTFRDTAYDATCANCGTYEWLITSSVTGVDTTIYISDLPDAYQQKIYYDSLKTALGYDSIYVLYLTAYPNYDFVESDEVCQGQTYNWTGHMSGDNGVVHRLLVDDVAITEIPTQKYGTIFVTDSMVTDTIYTNPKTGNIKPMHCDSVHVLTLVIHPTYNDRYVNLTDSIGIASNDTISHFISPHTLYVGYDFDFEAAGTSKSELEQRYDSVIYIPRSGDELYRDSVVNLSQYGCDSVHYVEITICRMKFVQLYDSIADNDSTWFFGGETSGGAHTLPLVTGHKFHTYDDGTPVDYSMATGRVMREYLFIDTLVTARGCDSIVHDSVRVFPAYRFQFDTTVCANNTYNWRKYTYLNLGRSGFVYDSVNYHVGTHEFDSVYVLDLGVVPSGYWQFDTTLCMNDTMYWHHRKVFFQPGGLNYVEVTYKDDSHMCGDVYHMDLTFARYYGSTLVEYDTICQDDVYQWISPGETNVHTEALYDGDGHAISAIPTDQLGEFVYYDSLKTKSCGCDSTYTLHLVVKPAFHFYSDTTICAGEDFTWIVKDKDGNDYTNGKIYHSDISEHLYDTIPGTTAYGCDSTYYLHIFVDQPYDIYLDTTLCASDRHFEWNGTTYDALIINSHTWVEPREYFDTIWEHTVVGQCDSTMYLHLTIAPSADSVWTDTICLGETYTIYEHEYTTSGLHTFHRENEWGCDVTYKLTLKVIDPTQVTIHPEPICINDAGADHTYTVRYSYQGEFQPVLYSVHYDSAALAAGFEDQDSVVITAKLVEGKEYELHIPTPVLTAKESYPRPDIYHATMAFENGVCLGDSLMSYAMELQMNYPNWLLEQRHGDVIALLNEQYNGGYTWTEYQWYQGDEKLIGQTKPYLYIPTGLTPGALYHVELIRTNDSIAFPTCEITAVANPIYNDYGPTKGYLAVTPTCVITGHPVIYILSRKDGTYRISSTEGHLVSEGVFHADATEVALPAVTGMYIVQLWSNDTPEEPYRAIKVLVREQCPNCDTSF